jgi:hypothetical protein
MLEGGCLCGQVRYHVDGPALVEAVCHCRNCQKQGGSAFSVIVGVAADALKLDGQPALFLDHGESGNPVNRYFCGACGSPIYSGLPGTPQVVYLKAGTLDDPTHLAPKMNVWCDSAWDSTLFPPDAIKVARNPG